MIDLLGNVVNIPIRKRKSDEILNYYSEKEINKFFGCGKIYLNKRKDNHHEHLLKFVVRNRDDLILKVIPFFEKNQFSLRVQSEIWTTEHDDKIWIFFFGKQTDFVS